MAVEFYAFRSSVILPSWTPRFKVGEFRNLTEETVRLNCPAHVQPEFCWLDLEKMQAFEELYRSWLEKLGDAGSSRAVLNCYANQLIVFLHKHKDTDQRESESDADQRP